MRPLLLALLLGACTAQAPPDVEAPTAGEALDMHVREALAAMPSWEQARTAGVDFRGVGQEPGWILDIYRADRIVLVWDYGESSASFPLVAPSYPQEGATRYESQSNGRALAITIRRFPCQDAMSGEAFPASVEVIIDGRTLEGCGRTV